MKPRWSWKVASPEQNARLDMRYEPGCWGDLLKGAWAIALGRALAARAAGKTVRVLDPFAGAPAYPLVPGTERRLDALAAGEAGRDPLVAALLARAATDRARGEFVSAAHFVQTALLESGAACDLAVFDLHPQRRAAWAAHPGARVLPVTSGEHALPGPADVAFVDPYDMDACWPSLRAQLATQREALTLIYLFNHAPKNANALREYRAWRADLDAAVGPDRALVVGRVPSDALLPRAWHEVLVAGPRDVVSALAPALRASAQAIARQLSDDGAFEGHRL